MKHVFPLLAALLASACASTGRDPGPAPPADPHSFSAPARVQVTHVSLDLDLDFAGRRVSGTSRLELERRDPSAPLVLDTLNLAVEGVTGADGSSRPFHLGRMVEGFGRPLTIELEPNDRSVSVAYRTEPEGAHALQWLEPEQTAGGVQPFLFTQGQAILTRTWIPLQDSPGVRVTYDARVRAPEGLRVLMSAEQRGRAADGTWRFELDQPIPPYLIALACGELESRAISERAAVWAEPAVVEAAHWELADTEEMIQEAEELYGPYLWGRYDVLILPPAFPYGGMENPLLTFATPTILAGDRSLVSLVAHELAHSWSGNLVTNATWRDFWLNEGFTVYFENRIMEAVYGAERARMEMQLAMDTLRRAVEGMEPWATVLHLDLAGRHPDDGFSIVPYFKGAAFLKRLEEVAGRAELDAFLRRWFDGHAFESVTTPDFEAFLRSELLAARPAVAAEVDVDAWLHEPGIPADLPEPESDALAEVDREIERLKAGARPDQLRTDEWVTQQWLHFLEGLRGGVRAEDLEALDEAFAFTGTGNSEILCLWLQLAIETGYDEADERLKDFLMDVGRRKFLQPLYQALVQTEAGRERAREIYARARPRYHSVSTGTLDAIVLEE